ncbi:MAG TPA: hypothetical protein VNV66_01745, partial [Pilimelia sp.]|nr:hypothetical protein [Pilimelia sp.]
ARARAGGAHAHAHRRAERGHRVSVLAAYVRARAVAAGVAQPTATVRHVHLAPRPLVLVPLTLAGEANAPLAALLGTGEAEPELLLVPQPRNRDLRFAFAAELASRVLAYVAGCVGEVEAVPGGGRYADAPQLVVPNPGGVAFLRLFGRATRFRRPDGPYPVDPGVPLLGRWLTWFAERAEHPGSCVLLAATEALGRHWATGQSALEDANLGALLGWIDPPPGCTGREAARRAEDPACCPPAGPATDPGFDNEVLAPAVAAWGEAPEGSAARAAARAALAQAVRGQLEPTWRLVWRSLALLRALPPGESVAERWGADRAEFTGFFQYVAGGGAPQPRRDGAVAAARRLARLEREQAEYDAARAFDDPLVMAGHRAAGEAFQGTVVEVDRERRVPGGKGRMVTRPLVRLVTGDPVHLAEGTRVVAVQRRGQSGVLIAADPVAADPVSPGGVLVTLELSGGMGRAAVPPPGTVPEPGEVLCYTSVLPDSVPAPALPDVADTPWTHGGPPTPYRPTDDDARERWE